MFLIHSVSLREILRYCKKKFCYFPSCSDCIRSFCDNQGYLNCNVKSTRECFEELSCNFDFNVTDNVQSGISSPQNHTAVNINFARDM